MNQHQQPKDGDDFIPHDYNDRHEAEEEEPQAASAAAAPFMTPGVNKLSSNDGEDLEQPHHHHQQEPLKKRHKASNEETINEGRINNSKAVSAAPKPKEQRTGICQKLAAINKEIEEKEKAIAAKEKEITRKTNAIQDKEAQLGETPTTDYSQDPIVLIALMREKDALWREKDALMREERTLTALMREEKSVTDKIKFVTDKFTSGKYYAATADYLKVETINHAIPKDSKWKSFVRETKKEEVSNYQCRDATATAVKVFDPYALTYKGVTANRNCVPKSDTARSSTVRSTIKNRLWPTDIFGNKPGESEEIAHLMPAGGKKSHKQWLNVAAAVLGFMPVCSLEEKKKAARGYKARKRDKRKPNSGVVHFVSNKIRLMNQRSSLDGTRPKVLIIPVMSLEEAKNWRGQGYDAICSGGFPRGSFFDCIDADSVYKSVCLNQTDLYQVDYTCDALEKDIQTAVAFLRQGVLALRDMIANLTEEEIAYADGDADKKGPLRKAHEEAKDTTETCKVPSLLSPLQEKKPVCLISFGNVMDAHRHPSPDPLLLVLKAANNFGIMAGMKMLANGSNEDEDDDISERDIMAEEAFLEARERSLRPKTWSDLAIGLGQPNGYLASGLNERDS